MSHRVADLRGKTALGITGAGFLLGFVVAAFHYSQIQLVESSIKAAHMTYTNLVTILLAVAALGITSVGIILGVAAFFGFNGLKSVAKEAAMTQVTDQLGEGRELRSALVGTAGEEAIRHIESELGDHGQLRRILEDKVEELFHRHMGTLQDDFGDEDDEYGADDIGDESDESGENI